MVSTDTLPGINVSPPYCAALTEPLWYDTVYLPVPLTITSLPLNHCKSSSGLIYSVISHASSTSVSLLRAVTLLTVACKSTAKDILIIEAATIAQTTCYVHVITHSYLLAEVQQRLKAMEIVQQLRTFSPHRCSSQHPGTLDSAQ